ncbi:MAG TPA: methyltransferase domain-containing protein [Woeseiaceae bacterium]|nr:methyltransferase domain-containing protein [Woeseiaceae bacterium]
MKATALLFLGLLSVAACDQQSTGQAGDTQQSIYQDAVDSKTRLAADYARDAGRKPAEVLAFFAIQPGDTVLDMFSGGGYYAELIAHVIGPDGELVAQTNQAYIGFVGDEVDERYADGRLANVELLMAENNELELPANHFDAITLILAYHDVYHEDPENGWPKIDVEPFLAELYQSLKPGGIVGVVDHYADAGAAVETGDTLHRIDPARVIEDFTAAGFELDARSDILRNADDDHTLVVFDPAIRGKTDRFVLRFKKP